MNFIISMRVYRDVKKVFPKANRLFLNSITELLMVYITTNEELDEKLFMAYFNEMSFLNNLDIIELWDLVRKYK